MDTTMTLLIHLLLVISTVRAYNFDMLNLSNDAEGSGTSNIEEALIEHQDCPSSEFECTGLCEPTWRQLSPSLVVLDWTGLWPGLDDTSCIQEIAIIPGDDSLDSQFEATIVDQQANVTVDTCVQKDLKVKLILKTGKVLLSEIIDVMTYDQPVLSENAKDDVHVDYKKQLIKRIRKKEERPPDFTRVVVEGRYKAMGDNPGILVDHPAFPECRKVKSVSLLYKSEAAKDWKEETLTIPEELPKIEMWEDEDKVKHRDAEVEILEFCKKHLFKLRIEGMEGTDVIELELDSLGPAPLENFGDDYGNHKIVVPGIIKDKILFRPAGDTDIITWSHPACVDGFILQFAPDDYDCIADADWEEEEYCYSCDSCDEDYCEGCYNNLERTMENVPEDETELEHVMTDLEPCSPYIASITPIRHLAGGEAHQGKPVFETFYSHPDMTEPFEVDNFEVTATETMIELSFDTSKYPCISQYRLDICQQDNNTCHQHLMAVTEEDFLATYTLSNLAACSIYNVSVRPVLGGEEEQEVGEKVWNEQVAQVETQMVKEAVSEVTVESVSNSSVTVTWQTVPCAQSYELLVVKVLAEEQEGSASHSKPMEDLFFEDDEDSSGDGIEEQEPTKPSWGWGFGSSNDDDELEETTTSNEQLSDEDVEEESNVTEGETTTSSWWGRRKRSIEDLLSLDEEQSEGSANDEYGDDEDLSTTAMTKINQLLGLDDLHDKDEAKLTNVFDENKGVLNDLEACTDYDLWVKTNFEDGTDMKSNSTGFKTKCVAQDWKKSVNIVTDKLPMMLSWKGSNENTFNVSLECQNNQEGCNSIEDFFDENTEKYAVPIDSYCAQYSVKITKGVEDKDVYEKNIVTIQNPHQPLELKEFRLEMNHTKYNLRPTQTEGSIKAYWKHTHPCISTYGVRLCKDNGNQCGEKNVQAPKINESIEIDLHMIPGISKLEQCFPFQLYILPDKDFVNFDPSYEGDLLWKQGYTKKFTYIPGIDPPRNPEDVRSERNFILYNDKYTLMEWIPPNKCVQGHQIKIFAIRHLFDIRLVQYPNGFKELFGWNQTIDEPLVVNETISGKNFWNTDEEEYTFNDSNPCILYRAEIQSIYKDFYSGEIISEPFVQQFRTDYDETNAIPYTNQEVFKQPFEGNSRQIMFSFMNRCAPKYYLSLCSFPKGCENDQYTTYTKMRIEEAETRHYYEQLVSYIAPCSVYKYQIMDGGNNKTLKKDFLFSEIDPDVDFEMKLMDYKIETNENSVNISWVHTQPCIDDYQIQVCPLGCKTAEQTTTKKPWSWKPWGKRNRRQVDQQDDCSCWEGSFDVPEIESDDDFLIDIDLLDLSDFSVGFEECHQYEISVTPSLNHSLMDAPNKRPFYYYTKAEPPKSMDISETTANSFVVSWNNSHCSDGTEILIGRISEDSEQSEKIIEEIKLEKGEKSYKVSGLAPCTDYSITAYGLHKGKRSEHPLIMVWITEHLEDIPYQIDITDSAELLITLNKKYNTKCLSECAIELCSIDNMDEGTASTTSKPWSWWKKSKRVRRQVDQTQNCRNNTIRPDEFCVASEAMEKCLLNVTNINEMELYCQDNDPDECLYSALNLNETNREFIMESSSNQFDYRIICSDHDNHTIFESDTKRLKFSSDFATIIAYNITDIGFKLNIESNYFDTVEEGIHVEKNLYITCTDLDDDLSTLMNGTNADFTYYNLKSATEYSCHGILVIDEETEVEMPKVTILTLDGIPNPPTDIQVKDRTSEGFNISWNKPKITNGELEFYRVSIKSDCENDGPTNCEPRSTTVVECEHEVEVLVNSSDTSFQYNGAPGTKFTVDVAAKTRNPIFGLPSEKLQVKTRSLKPHKPKIVRIEETFTNSIIIEFEYPCPHTGPTQFIPHWDCSNCSNKIQGEIIDSGSRFIQVRGLPGGSTYDMWIEAHVKGCVDENLDEENNISDNHKAECSVNSESMSKRIDCNYRCQDGSCINRDIIRKPVVCNWIKDCMDGSDEWNCTCDGFQCGSNYCIDETKRCNGIVDCNDATDEHNCPMCRHDQFTCESKECINQTLRCDKKNDCRDGSDELGCSYRRNICWPNKFKCFDGSCIPESKRCNRVPDCEQGEDEQSCELNCGLDDFTCRNGECIKKTSFCDNDIDCSDESDEPPHCHCYLIKEYPCENGNQCVKRQQRCDGKDHCNDGSDEKNCDRWTTKPTTQRTTTIDFSAFTGYPEYPYYKYVTPPTSEYPYINNDISRPFSNKNQTKHYDTNNIPETSHSNGGYPEYTYHKNEITPKSQQYPEYHQYNNEINQPFPSKNQTRYYNTNDISHTSFEDEPNKGFVSMSHIRQTKQQKLPEQDHHPNSVIYNDKQHPKRHHRNRQTAAPENMRQRDHQNQSSHHQRHKSGSQHNQPSRHETSTLFTEKQVDVKVYPQTQERKIREDVVIDCRDEGELRLDVMWERVGAAMPERATQSRGRLEISSVTSNDAGEYVCKVEGKEYEEGGSVMSSFTVTGY